MSRTLMISDIHGCIKQFYELLNVVNYIPGEDKLILLGDYVDRGPNNKETVKLVKDLVNDYNVIALRGNHDQRLVDLIRTDDEAVRNKFIEHGGKQTIQSYCCEVTNINSNDIDQARYYIKKNYLEHILFLQSLPLYYEDSDHIYVHAGLNPQYVNWREQTAHDFMYIKEEFHQSKPYAEKPVIFGHTRTVDLHDTADVWFNQGKIGIDGGCAYGMQLNCLVFSGGTYYSEHVKNT